MLIENLEAFKAWLTKTLSPACDADPAALAKYVCALVKKEKPESELREVCVDQLDVFLGQKTKGFVDSLFEALKTKSYITPSENSHAVVPEKTETKLQNSNSGLQLDRNDLRKKLEKAIDKEKTADDQVRRKSRSPSPRRARDVDERRRRTSDRPRYGRRRERSRSRSPRSRSGRMTPERERSRKRVSRDDPLTMVKDRQRGRSRSRSRGRSPRLGSRSPRSRSRSRSRPRVSQSDSRGSTPTQDNNLYVKPPVSGALPHIPSSVNMVTQRNDMMPHSVPMVTGPPPGSVAGPGSGPPPLVPGMSRPRCRDYDEKGFCMRGDMCPYDHGPDPVIVEDTNISSGIPFPPPGMAPSSIPGPGGPPRPPPPPPPPGASYPPPGPQIPPPRPPPMVDVHGPPPPRPGPFISSEGYNPEAPGMNTPRPRFWSQPPPHHPPPPHPPNSYYTPHPHQPPPQRQRDLVQVPTLPEEPEVPNLPPQGPLHHRGNGERIVKQDNKESPDKETLEVEVQPAVSSRVVVPSKRMELMQQQQQQQYPYRHEFQGYRGRGRGRGAHRYQPYGARGKDVFHRLGPASGGAYTNLSLEVRKVPHEENTIAKLNEHFGKFGTLTNIQVCFEGDPEAALVTYSRNSEAYAAYKSSEPVFNNRFIKVFWHKPADSKPTDSKPTDSIQVQDSGSATPQQQMQSMNQGEQESSVRLPVRARLGLPPQNKMSLDNTVTSTATLESVAKGIVYTSSVGNLKKTVFNPEALKTRRVIASPTAVNSADYVKKMEEISEKKALHQKKEELAKKSRDARIQLHKSKQLLLQVAIKNQKEYLKKLEEAETLEEKKIWKEKLLKAAAEVERQKAELAPKPAQAVKTVHSMEQKRRELLDLELELIARQNSGVDTLGLRCRIIELTKEITGQSLVGLRGRGRGRGTPRGRGAWPGRGRGHGGSLSLDNRPKTLEVKGFQMEEKDELQAHFANFGEVDKVEFNPLVPSAVLTFKHRQGAEKAVSQGGKFKDKLLLVRWYTAILRRVSSEQAVSDDDESQAGEEIDEDALLAADEDEEDDEESRSWRR